MDKKQLRVTVSFRDEAGFHRAMTWPIDPEMTRTGVELYIQNQVYLLVSTLPAANFFDYPVTAFSYVNVDENEFRAKALHDVLKLPTTVLVCTLTAGIWRGIRHFDYTFPEEAA